MTPPPREGVGPFGAESRQFPLRAADGPTLRGATAPGGERGLAVLLHGRTEFCEKHAPVVAELTRRGFSVATLDWRGQGLSDRTLDDRLKGHVGDFAEYQRDLDALLAHPGTKALGPPKLVVAHSMGGGVALRALIERRLEPQAAVFSAPMWGLFQSRIAGRLARVAARVLCGLGFAARYAPGGASTVYAEAFPGPNLLTSDPEQARWIAGLTKERRELAIGGPTWGWVRAAYSEIDALENEPTPMNALVAVGDGDEVVSRKAIAARAGRDGLERVDLAGARHEPFFEAAPIRKKLWAAIDAHLDARGV